MSISAWRVVLWVLGVLSLLGIVVMGSKSLATPGFLDWEFLGFVLSTMAFEKSIRTDEKLKNQEND